MNTIDTIHARVIDEGLLVLVGRRIRAALLEELTACSASRMLLSLEATAPVLARFPLNEEIEQATNALHGLAGEIDYATGPCELIADLVFALEELSVGAPLREGDTPPEAVQTAWATTEIASKVPPLRELLTPYTEVGSEVLNEITQMVLVESDAAFLSQEEARQVAAELTEDAGPLAADLRAAVAAALDSSSS